MTEQPLPSLPDIELRSHLQARWVDLWQRIGATGDPQPPFEYIMKRYTESHRAYHNLTHISHSLKEFDEVRHLTNNPGAIEMALWLHDVIYDRTSEDEEKSAEYAQQLIFEAGLSQEFGSEVARLILTTKHNAVAEDIDAKILTDIDLSILGQPQEIFDEYEDNIRREYDFVDDDAFHRGRVAVMRSLYERNPIYATEYFREKLELRAKENLERSLQRWSVE